MGRLTLNVLLSFAQFEREVGAERVRDKIAASRKKGIWTGGKPPLGYDNVEKKLVVNKQEAEIIREIFRIYHETQCVKTIIQTGAKNSWVTKRNPNGVGGKPLSRGPIYWILKNPIYAGLIKGKNTLYEAQHDAIIDRKVWDDVQRLLGERSQWSGSVKSEISPLASLLYWEGKRLSPSHSTKQGKRHRYYISDANKSGVKDRIRLKADDVEQAVVTAISGWLSDPMQAAVSMLSEDTDASIISKIAAQLEIKAKMVDVGRSLDPILPFTTQVDLSDTHIKVALYPRKLVDTPNLQDVLRDEASIESPITLKKRGQELRLLLGNCMNTHPPDPIIVGKLITAHRLKKARYDDNDYAWNAALTKVSIDRSNSHRILRLAFLAPDIVDAFLTGKAPIDLNAEKLKRLSALPSNWDDQRRLLGMPPQHRR